MSSRPVFLFRSLPVAGSVIALVAGALTGTSTPLKATTALYTITDLGSAGGRSAWGFESAAMAVNNAGDVAGTTTSPTDSSKVVPFFYRNGVMHVIQDGYGWATSVNDAGQVTGFVQLAGEPNVHAFLYQDGVFTDIGTVPGYSNQPYSIGYAINNSGTIVGDSDAGAMIYENGTMRLLKRHGARYASAINDAGDVVGILQTMAQPNATHPFLFSGNSLVDLGTLDGDRGSPTVPTGINRNQQIVGYGWNAQGMGQRAWMYEHGVMRDLGTLSGRPEGFAWAMGLNNLGHVVGFSDWSNVLWRDGSILNLNTAFEKDAGGVWPSLQDVYAINDRGQIVGSAYFGDEYGNGHLRAFIMTPVSTDR